MIVDHGVSGRALEGQVLSGDRGLVLPFPGGALVAAIDGLGHGREAAQAAEVATQVLEADPSAPVLELLARCHGRLHATRGAVIALASIDAARNEMTWIG